MRLASFIYRISLALLLLGGLLSQRVQASSAPAALYAYAELGSNEGSDFSVVSAQDASDFFLHAGRQMSPGVVEKDHRVSVPRLVLCFSSIEAGATPCSKSVLKRRLRVLQEHFTYPQRLSLFPKHFFW